LVDVNGNGIWNNFSGPRSIFNVTALTVLISTMAVNTKSFEKYKRRKTKEGDARDIVMANTIQVPNDIEYETSEISNDNADKQEMVSSRLVAINQYREKFGLNDEAIIYLCKQDNKNINKESV
jgi:hypothetical protein